MTCIFVLPFLVLIISATGWWKRGPKDMCPFAKIRGRGLGDITKGTHNYSIGVGFPKIFRDGTRSNSTFVRMIALHVGIYSCKGVCSNNACITPNTHVAPLTETITTLHHLHPLVEVDLPPFVDNFHWTIFCFNMFSTSFIRQSFECDVWAFARLFYP